MPKKARLFGLAPGVDFPKALVQGLETLMENAPPEDWARVTLILNTTRMARRVRDIFDAGPPRLVPRVLLLGNLDQLLRASIPPAPATHLRRRLELARLIRRLMEERPDFGAKGSVFDLADSLATLMDEMQSEDVGAQTIASLDVSDHSEHFAQTQAFLGIAQTYLAQSQSSPDAETRQRQVVQNLIEEWQQDPPRHPIILAGSTASRGTTRLLAEAVAQLDMGHVVLPGFDFDLPDHVWPVLGKQSLPTEDHPQFRLYRLMSELNLTKADIQNWAPNKPFAPARNRLISLALRPAPVTYAWRAEGPELGDLVDATKDLTLIEAESPRAEALAIALRLRQAAEFGQTAALISPDRMLTRQVSAALDSWNILPDDSAGTPLHLSPVGRFLRHTAELFSRPLSAESLITLLKHPLTQSAEDRNLHMLNTQRLELYMRRTGMPFPDPETLGTAKLTLERAHGEEIGAWLDWVASSFCGHEKDGLQPLASWLETHLALSETIAKGQSEGESKLWLKNAGETADKVMKSLLDHVEYGDDMVARDYQSLLHALLSREDVRDADAPHPGVMIWGTLEARVEGADLVILGSLNDGTWPEQPAPDPWLNRKLRHDAGLTLPDQGIGLSAHDFQQAIAGKEVLLTRALRTSDAETVPSRWINRLMNLLSGLPETKGPEALREMRARGQVWLSKARAFETPIHTERATRPAPQPPIAARPRDLSVSDVRTLIRDPYAIYAKHCLGLRQLGPLVPQADALLRGIAAHQVLEDFVKTSLSDPSLLTAPDFVRMATSELEKSVPWPAARALWLTRIERVADWFVEGEMARQTIGQPAAFEERAQAKLLFSELGMAVTARADRIDELPGGDLIIYDYKTGKPPSAKQQIHFDRQLLIEAAMAEEGAFAEFGPRRVEAARYIGVGTSPTVQDAPLETEPPTKVIDELRKLLIAYLDPNRGYVSRRAHLTESDVGDYDLLARYGEWETSDPAEEETVG